MRIEPLSLGKAYRGRGENIEARGIAANDRRALHEIENAEARGEPSTPGGRQHMVGPGDIIADRFRGVTPEKDCARVTDPRCHSVGIVDRQFEVLWGNPVD